MQCRITYDNGQPVAVRNEDGTSSRLFNELSKKYSPSEALNMWAMSTTREFEAATGLRNTNDMVAVENYFENVFVQEQDRLSPAEKFQTSELIPQLGFSSAEFLQQAMQKTIIAGEVNISQAILEGILTPEEAKNLDVDNYISFFGKLSKTLETEGLEIIPTQKAEYKNTSEKTLIGTFVPISEEQIVSELINSIQDFSNQEEIFQKISELPYAEFIDKFQNNTTFSENLLKKLSTKVRTPLATVVGDTLVLNNAKTITTLRNTLRTDIEFIPLEAQIELLEDISKEVWDDEQAHVKSALKKLEKLAAKNSIDIVGISEYSSDYERVLSLVGALKSFLNLVENRSLTDESITMFSQTIDNFFDKTQDTEVMEVGNNKNYTLLKIESLNTDSEMFETLGLIRVADNLYHKVDQNTQKSDLYEYLYDEYMEGRYEVALGITKKASKLPQNKPIVLQAISDKINSAVPLFVTENKEMLNLFSAVFNHNNENQTTAQQKIGSITRNNAEYLKTDFISDFYNLVLTEKLANTSFYNSILSNFKITDKGIDLQGEVLSLDGFPENIREDLENYIRLRKDSYMDHLITNTEVAPEGLLVVNDPNAISEYSESFSKEGRYIITKPNQQNYIKVSGEIYKKKILEDNAHLYAPIEVTQDNNVFYNIEPKVIFKEQIAKEVIKRYGRAISKIDSQQAYEQGGINTSFSKQIQQRATNAVSRGGELRRFNSNLIKFIRSKGIDVVTDSTLVRRALAESGFSNLNAVALNVRSWKYTPNVVHTAIGEVTITWGSGGIEHKNNAYGAAQRYREKAIEEFRQRVGQFATIHPNHVKITDLGDAIKVNVDFPQAFIDNYNKAKQDYTDIEDTLKQISLRDVTEDVVNKITEELGRGVSLPMLKDLGYNFISTPAGEILGFERNGRIYLDESNLNTVTTIHELIHVWQSLIEVKAQQGDKQAQEIVAKRKELFANDVTYWMDFHTGVLSKVEGNFQTTSSQRDLINLEAESKFIEGLQEHVRTNKDVVLSLGLPTASLISAGIKDLPIEIQSSQLNLKTGKHRYKISDVADLPADIQNPIAIFQSKTHADSEVLLLDTSKDGYNMVAILRENPSKGINDIRSVYPKTNIKELVEWIGEDNLMEWGDKKRVLEILSKHQSHSGEVTRKIKDATKVVEKFENPKISGENFQILGETPLSEIGLDLSSPVYAQRQDETAEQWRNRLEKEVEAYVTAPEIADRLEILAKENPSLWKKIVDFINSINSWLKTQIGLSDYNGDIASLSREEYITALGNSVLKDNYSVISQTDVTTKDSVITSGIQMNFKLSEEESSTILNEIDACGK